MECYRAAAFLAKGACVSSRIHRRTLEWEFLVADGEDNSSPKCSNLGWGVPNPPLSLSLSYTHNSLFRAREEALWSVQNECISFPSFANRAASFSSFLSSHPLNWACPKRGNFTWIFRGNPSQTSRGLSFLACLLFPSNRDKIMRIYFDAAS